MLGYDGALFDGAVREQRILDLGPRRITRRVIMSSVRATYQNIRPRRRVGIARYSTRAARRSPDGRRRDTCNRLAPSRQGGRSSRMQRIAAVVVNLGAVTRNHASVEPGRTSSTPDPMKMQATRCFHPSMIFRPVARTRVPDRFGSVSPAETHVRRWTGRSDPPRTPSHDMRPAP